MILNSIRTLPYLFAASLLVCLPLLSEESTEPAAESCAPAAPPRPLDLLLSTKAVLTDSDLLASLLDKGADPNTVSGYNQTTALMRACEKGYYQAAQILIEKGADVNLTNDQGVTALSKAIEGRQVHCLGLLLDHGASLAAKKQDSEFPTNPLVAAIGELDDHTINRLIDLGADIHTAEWRQSPLVAAIREHKTQIFNRLLDMGASVNCERLPESPLWAAIMYGTPKEVCRLLDAGADISGDEYQFNALHLAACEGNLPAAKLLIERGMDVNCRTADGMTPLAVAARESAKNTEVARYLVSKGADVNAVESDYHTPVLTQWIRSGNMEVAQLLIKKGADLNIANQAGQTPLHALVDSYYSAPPLSMLQRMVEMGANCNAADQEGQLPVNLVADHDSTELFDYLIQHTTL